MSKAKTLATTVSTGNVLADGTVAYAEVSGTPTLATVATSGAYADITGTPTLATVATSGSYTDLTNKPTITDTATNIAGGSNGTIPYQTAADTTAMLAAGTAGQLLQTNGAGAPTWVDAAGGATVLLSTVTASSSSTVDVETTFDSTYDYYLLVATGIKISVDGAQLRMRMKIGGSYITTSSYLYVDLEASSEYGLNVVRTTLASPGSYINVTAGAGNSAEKSTDLIIKIFTPSNTSFAKIVSWESNYILNNNVHYKSSGGGRNTGTGALTGIRFFAQAGTIDNGKFRLYGIVNS